VVGDWIGSGQIQLGVFDPVTQQWELDRNANDKWEDCAVDICRGPFGLDVIAYPVAGYWKDGNITATAMSLGAFRASVGLWYLDLNNNGRFEISTDLRLGPFGSPTDLPIVGDWTGSGSTKIGTFTPGTGLWHLDRNNNGKFEGCDVDICASPFGKSGDLPVAADWDGVGKDKIGLFESTTGMWKLDLNGNGRFDDCKIDRCMGPFGTTGDLPVVGKW
jgi:hypothetical protein